MCVSAAPVDFAKDIRPILETSCFKCHGGAVQLAKLDLRTRESALNGGEHGPVLVPGKSQESKLYRLVAGVEKPAMPMDGKLSAAQVATVAQWIDGGAKWDDAAPTTNSDSKSQLAA